MTTRGDKFAFILLWGLAGLIILGLVLGCPRLLPYIETMLYMQRIPTAPPFAITVTPESEPVILASSGSEVDDSPTPQPPSFASPVPTATPPLSAPTLSATSPAASSSPTPSATPTEVFVGTTPIEVKIPSIFLEAPIEPIGWKIERVRGQEQAIWEVPDYFAAGWHRTSAPLGLPGNTVLNGHNTQNGEVFRDLYKVEIGDQIFVKGEDGKFYAFKVEVRYILREAGQPLEVRLANARYIERTPDTRLTLVTCHPYGSLANRLVVIAHPDSNHTMESGEGWK